ncbi:MAG TPA: hypothetical protein VJ741_02995 [Solirubrobacteraceae bacterium]|nr:hypothetical protein [Solirubrobacteraceae bacterium]
MNSVNNRLFGPARLAAPAMDRLFDPARVFGPARLFGPASDRLFGPARLASRAL